MDKNQIIELITWATFTIAAFYYSYRMCLSGYSKKRLAISYIITGSIFTILFGLGHGLAFFIVHPIILKLYFKKSVLPDGISPENISSHRSHLINNPPIISNNLTLEKEKQKLLAFFSDIFDLIELHIKTGSALCGNKITNINEKQYKKFLAFELGVIEWHDQSVMKFFNDEADSTNEIIFYKFLHYYCGRKYNSKEILSFYIDLFNKGIFIRERKLGFDSVNDGINNPGHLSHNYILRALNLDWP